MKYCPACAQNYPDSQRLCLNDGQLLSLPDPYHLVGLTLMDKYRIEALVGIGGMGAVYGAHHLPINRRVAFKILLPNLALGNQNMLANFQREALLAGQLNQENIVDIKDAGQTPEGLAYIVMEWLDGHTLDDELLEKRLLTLERTGMILRQIAAALDHAHLRGVIHRDLKPTNIMIVRHPDGREQVKVVDFGIARAVSGAASSVITTPIGTLHYASPEQFVQGGLIDRRSDIYSLGVLLFQMLSGRLPFNAQSPPELLRKQKAESPPSISQYRADVPVAIDQLLIRMLARNPAGRPQTAKEASAIFEHVLNVVLGRRATFSDINSPTVKETPAITQGEDAPSRTDRENAVTSDSDHSAKTLPQGDAAIGIQSPLHSAATVVEPAKTEPVPGPTKLRHYVIGAVLALAIIIAVATLYRDRILPLRSAAVVPTTPSPTPMPRIELMSYYLEISPDQCRSFTRGSGDESLVAGQAFRLHFKPRESGYLYLISQNERNVPTTFLTAQSDPRMGVKTNFVEAGSDFSFPSGGGDVACFGITNEPMMALTVIFSPTPLASPSFLTAPARRELNGAEQLELRLWRQPYENSAPQIRPEAKQQLSQVTVVREPGVAAKPVIFDLLIKRR
jgi:serine/threonine protein kinase